MTGQPLQVTGEKTLMDKDMLSASSDTLPPIGRGEIKENTTSDSLDEAVKEAPDIFVKEIIPTLIQINKAFKGNKKELEKLYAQWGKSLMTFAAPKLRKMGIKQNSGGEKRRKQKLKGFSDKHSYDKI